MNSKKNYETHFLYIRILEEVLLHQRLTRDAIGLLSNSPEYLRKVLGFAVHKAGHLRKNKLPYKKGQVIREYYSITPEGVRFLIKNNVSLTWLEKIDLSELSHISDFGEAVKADNAPSLISLLKVNDAHLLIKRINGSNICLLPHAYAVKEGNAGEKKSLLRILCDAMNQSEEPGDFGIRFIPKGELKQICDADGKDFRACQMSGIVYSDFRQLIVYVAGTDSFALRADAVRKDCLILSKLKKVNSILDTEEKPRAVMIVRNEEQFRRIYKNIPEDKFGNKRVREFICNLDKLYIVPLNICGAESIEYLLNNDVELEEHEMLKHFAVADGNIYPIEKNTDTGLEWINKGNKPVVIMQVPELVKIGKVIRFMKNHNK